MASARQIAANRRNASLPRGPLSEAAAAVVRENAQKHGLTAKHVVLRHEDFANYQELRASIVTEYHPATPQEHRLADQIAQNYWRLLRCRRVETATFENRLDTLKTRLKVDAAAPIDDDQGVSICMSNEARDFDTIRRYETTIERAWYRAIRELRTVQKERHRIEVEEAEEAAYNPPLEDTLAERRFPVFIPSENKLFDIGIGCDSQQEETHTGPASPLLDAHPPVTTPGSENRKYPVSGGTAREE
jgi:hypothetical protein